MPWISTETVATGVDAPTWQQAVRAAGELLVHAKAAEARYVDAMIKTVEELGPYAVIAPGVALPHARPEDGALRAGFAAITLSQPIPFGNPDNDPVRLVIAFCAPDSNGHINSLRELAILLEQPDFADRAAEARTPQDLTRILSGETSPE